MGTDLHIHSSFEQSLTLSVFVLAYAFGPFVIGPLSEVYGRVVVLQLANLWYLVFNIACGSATSKGQMIAFRFLAGIGGRWVFYALPCPFQDRPANAHKAPPSPSAAAF